MGRTGRDRRQQLSRGLAQFALPWDQFELEYLRSLMQTTYGNVWQAARLAARNRSEFYKLLKKHSLDPADFRRLNSDEPE